MSIGNNTNNPNVELKYQGFDQTATIDTLNTTITYQSTQNVLTAMVGTTWVAGSTSGQYGRLDSVHIQQADGPFFNATLTYSKTLSAGVQVSFGVNKPQQNSLTVKMISMPIESHPNYKYIWNHSVAANYGSIQIDYSDVSGFTGSEANAWAAEQSGRVRWIKDSSELPTDLYEEQIGNSVPPQKVYNTWKINVTMTKPGVEYYDYPTYEITEYTRHSNREQAAWCISTKSGKLKFPEYGDFGLEAAYPTTSGGYRWLCQGGNINYDGKYYVAQCTFQWSPDPDGWDQECYQVASGGYGKVDKGANPIL